MPIVLNGTTGITTPTYNGSTTAEYLVPVTGFKNRIINGDMTIDQRNAGASVTIPANAYTYSVDRWFGVCNQASKFSLQQDAGAVTPPVGFNDYLGATSLSAYSVISTDYFTLGQAIEGFNFADLGWGTANAKTITLSFWVRSSLTGTFGGVIQNSAQARAYPFSYTINAANTWEYETITIAGDTSGTWLTTNGIGARIFWSLGAGSVQSGTAGAWVGGAPYSVTGATSVVGTNGATFYITGVQLEKGSNATSFDYLPYSTELALCQRYYETNWAVGYAVGSNIGATVGYANTAYYTINVANGGVMYVNISFKVPKRTAPTGVMYRYDTGATGQWAAGQADASESFFTASARDLNVWGFKAYMNGVNSGFNTSYGFFAASAEL